MYLLAAAVTFYVQYVERTQSMPCISPSSSGPKQRETAAASFAVHHPTDRSSIGLVLQPAINAMARNVISYTINLPNDLRNKSAAERRRWVGGGASNPAGPNQSAETPATLRRGMFQCFPVSLGRQPMRDSNAQRRESTRRQPFGEIMVR